MVGTPNKDRALGLPRERSGNRFVTKYSPDLALQICERIAAGETLTAVTDEKKMPHWSTFHRWLVRYPELNVAYRAAREISAFSLEDEALGMARKLRLMKGVDNTTVQAYRVALDQLRWSAARRNPREYSDRSALKLTVPIQINTTLDMGEGADPTGGVDSPNIYTIEAKEVEVAEEDGLRAMPKKLLGAAKKGKKK